MRYFKSLTLFFMSLIILLLPCLPAEAFGPISGGYVYYNRVTTEYPVLNADTYTDSSFLNKYVGNNRNDYNIAPAFWKESRSKGASSMPSYLGYYTVFKHKDDDNTYRMYYQYDFEEALKPAAKKGDLRICYSATLTNDQHWNFERHWSTKTAYPYTYVKTSSKYLIEHETDDVNSDWTGTRGKHTFVPVGTVPANYKLYFGAEGEVCSCGSSKVSDINIVLADTVGPRVVSIYTSRLKPDGTMEPFVDFKGGDSLYINLEFNENIRFANDTPVNIQESPKLKLLIKRIDDNVQETGINVEAFLVSLDGKTLTFRYDVPYSYEIGDKSVQPNYYIYQIAPYNTQSSWISASKIYDLKLIGRTSGSKVSYVGTTRKTTSMIVDLAGNPIDTAGSTVALDSVAYMDSVPAVVRKIDVARTADINPLKVGMSDVYARVGEKIGFFVNFSEEMLYLRRNDGALLRPSNIYRDHDNKVLGYDMQNPFGTEEIHLNAELNVRKNNQTVTAVAKYMTTIQDGLNGPKISRVYFELEQPVSSDMIPWDYGTGRKLPIGINRIYIDPVIGKYYLADARGNIYDKLITIQLINAEEGERIMPAQQVYLDTAPPLASTPLSPGSAGYEPVSYAGGGNPTEFFFPINVYDSAAWGEEFWSGTNGVVGAFIWRDTTYGNTSDYTFEYAVTGSPDKPDEEDYKTGVTGKQYTFEQIDSGNYIHLRLLDEVEYNIGSSELVIKPVDNAGNIGNVPFKLDYLMDRQGPKINKEGYRTNFQYDCGYIIANMSAIDASGIARVEYQWTLPEETPLETGWTVTGSVYGEMFAGSVYGESVAGSVYGESVIGSVYGESVPESVYGDGPDKIRFFNIALYNLESNKKHQYNLHIKATDILGQTSVKSFYFEYDLTLPKYNIEFDSDPEELLPRHSAWLYFTEGSVYSPPDGAADRLLVLIKKPGTTDEYWGRTFRYSEGDIIGKDNAIDIFDVGPDAEGWTRVLHERDVVIWYDVDPAKHKIGDYYRHFVLTSEEKYELYEYINRSYRQIELTVIARQWTGEDEITPGTRIPNYELCARDTYKFNFAASDGVASGDRVHFADITAKSKVSYGSFYGPPNVVPYNGLPYDVLGMPKSLDGAVFNVSLRNQRMLAYDIKDIDFDSTDTYFALYKTGKEDTPLFTAPLIPKISQNITVPAGVALETGNYKVVVSVRSKATGRVDKNEYTSINIDRRTLDTYGVTQVRTRVNYQENPYSANIYPDTAITDYAISPGSRPAEILVSADMRADNTIVFKAENLQSLKYFDYTHYAAYIRVWSETANDVERVGPGMGIAT